MSLGLFTAFLTAFARASGVCFTAPLIGDPTTPARARLGLAIAIAIAVSPLWPPLDIGSAPLTLLLELATGLATGALARFALAGVEVAGQVLGLALGLGFAAQYDPQAGESASIIRTILSTITGLAFIGAGGIEAVARSVATGPANHATAIGWGAAVIERGDQVMGNGVALAAPVIIAVIIAQAGMALANRAAPALNVYAISFAVIMTVGALVMMTTAPTLVHHLWQMGQTAVDTLQGAAP